MSRFEGGMKRDITPAEQSGEGVLSDEQKQTEMLDRFEAGRAKVWADQEGFRGMEAEASDEKSLTETEQESILERLDEYEKKIEALREEISQKKDGWISRLTEFKQIRDLEARLKMTERMKNIAEEDKKRTDELIAGYDHIIAKDQDLASMKAEVKAVMEVSARERIVARDEEEKLRSVGDISRRHDCFMIHDLVVADGKPSANNRAVDTKQLSLTDQLDIVLGLEPTISASTLRAGNPQDKSFGQGSWGIFLSGGRTIGGDRQDAQTQAHSLRKRHISQNSQSVESIDDAITSPHKASYNELVVEKPEVAGLYIKWNDGMPPLSEITSVQNGNGVRYDGWWENMKLVAERGVPIFVLTADNHVRLIHDINFQDRVFQVGADIHPEDMVNLPGMYKQHLGVNEKRAAAMRQINTVRHLLSSEEVTDIESGARATIEDERNNPYALH